MSLLAQPATGSEMLLFVERLLAWFEEAGNTRYDQEVTQAEHALQAASLANRVGAPPSQVVAALFHDIGHLLLGEHNGRHNFLDHDARHETVGAAWLATVFPEAVAAPVRLHVPAKRWLCARDTGYEEHLSKSSLRSLALQGGPMNGDEAAAFENQPYWREAVAIRRWDDGAKVAGQSVPDFAEYRGHVLSLLEFDDGQAVWQF